MSNRVFIFAVDERIAINLVKHGPIYYGVQDNLINSTLYCNDSKKENQNDACVRVYSNFLLRKAGSSMGETTTRQPLGT